MAATFNLTNSGRIFLAENGSDKLTTFKLADVPVGAGTEIDPIQTPSASITIQDSVVHSGGFEAVSTDPADPAQVIYRIFLDENVGDFNFSQIGLF